MRPWQTQMHAIVPILLDSEWFVCKLPASRPVELECATSHQTLQLRFDKQAHWLMFRDLLFLVVFVFPWYFGLKTKDLLLKT